MSRSIQDKYTARHQFYLALAAVLIGAISGSAALLLRSITRRVEQNADRLSHLAPFEWLTYGFPFLGIVLTVMFIRFLRRGKRGDSLPHIVTEATQGSGNVDTENCYSPMITSAFTVGLGGSVGLEAPVASTGAGWGSLLARVMGYSEHDRVLLLACGAAAGITAIFNSPLAGLFFALEVILVEWSMLAFLPLMVACGTAAVIASKAGIQPLFYMSSHTTGLGELLGFMVLGMICALTGFYTSRVVRTVEQIPMRFQWRPWTSAGIGGVLLCVLIVLFPSLYGEGYDDVQGLLEGNTSSFNSRLVLSSSPSIVLLIAASLIVKPIAAGLTVGAGGNGGIFAPALYTGSTLGYLFGMLWTQTTGYSTPSATFMLAGMAGVLAAILHAPLTAIFLAVEISGQFTLLLPLIIVTVISLLLSKYIEPSSLYSNEAGERKRS